MRSALIFNQIIIITFNSKWVSGCRRVNIIFNIFFPLFSTCGIDVWWSSNPLSACFSLFLFSVSYSEYRNIAFMYATMCSSFREKKLPCWRENNTHTCVESENKEQPYGMLFSTWCANMQNDKNRKNNNKMCEQQEYQQCQANALAHNNAKRKNTPVEYAEKKGNIASFGCICYGNRKGNIQMEICNTKLAAASSVKPFIYVCIIIIGLVMEGTKNTKQNRLKRKTDSWQVKITQRKCNRGKEGDEATVE